MFSPGGGWPTNGLAQLAESGEGWASTAAGVVDHGKLWFGFVLVVSQMGEPPKMDGIFYG